MDILFAWAPAATLLGYLVVEGLIRSPGEASSWRPGSSDRGTTIAVIVALIVAGSMAAVLHLVGLSRIGHLPAEFDWLRPLGLAAAAAGLVLRAWSMRVLGAAYSRTLRVTGQQSIVRAGPYRWVRHPGYSGSIVALTGANLAAGSWLAALVAGLLLTAVYSIRTIAEERMLTAAFGEAYRDYRATSGRLLPTRPLKSLRATESVPS